MTCVHVVADKVETLAAVGAVLQGRHSVTSDCSEDQQHGAAALKL